jgi:hypothetical protein
VSLRDNGIGLNVHGDGPCCLVDGDVVHVNEGSAWKMYTSEPQQEQQEQQEQQQTRTTTTIPITTTKRKTKEETASV